MNTTVRTADNKLFQETGVFFADENFPEIFSLSMLSGNPAATLEAPWQVLLSEETARRYFGTEDPINRDIQLENQFRFKVAGVFRNFPQASHLHPEILLSFSSLRDSTLYGERRLQTSFGNNAFYTYFKAAANFDPQKMEARFPAFIDEVFPAPRQGATVVRKPHEGTRLHLQKLTDIHLLSHHDDEIEPGSDLARVRMFGIIALVILLIAGINYTNLSTAFSLARVREIGVRKSAGAFRTQVIQQFLTESMMLSLGAASVAYGLVILALPLLKKMLDVEIPLELVYSWQAPMALLATAVVSGLLAGAYPAFFMSSFKPVTALKGAASTGRQGMSLRKALVIMQFGATAILLVACGVVFQQLHYVQNKSLGLDKEHVITLLQNDPLIPKWETFRAELMSSSLVSNACRSSLIPSSRLLNYDDGTSVQLGDTMTPLTVTLKLIASDVDFAQTYKIPVAAGRDFSREFMGDTTHGWLLNEAAVRAIGWKNPEDAVGKRLVYSGREDCYVVGVLRDFNFESLHEEIVPMIFCIPKQKGSLSSISIKLAGNTSDALAHVEQVWRKFNPDFPFEYTFSDESYGQLYAAETRQGRLFLFFAGLAIFIACLGLFGLATFAAHQRKKEIGIRKTLGASVLGITSLLARDFLKLVLLATLIASPLSYILMQRWLADFAYHVDLQWWIFVGAALVAVSIAFLTVSYQSIKAALVNPVKSLRSE
jgi:putative ABC transport system permease protein